ncbi:MAG: AAA family ATPase [Candidatus Omnitrophica bacterium]|nr:AAA family ATPase [Candidatus Omnitrophota bacterium]MDD5352570.1 AAA family ATPase [Candidatus Omnitrophota bacterium]MDD5550168.1 AAA family ATPase [Candidatus Omnitrophota bacterium]
MNNIIAFAGKGGVGKTTIASLLIRYLVKQKAGSVLAIDADPNSNLGELLGFKPTQDIGRIIDDISRNISQIPLNMSKDEFISYRIETTLDEAEGFDLLTLGRPEGTGCYCYVNNVLRNVSSKLMSNYDYIVIDNEAGFEHLSRKTLKKIDTLIIISDSTPQGLKAARRIFDLVKELKIEYKEIYLVVNRVKLNKKTDIDFPAEIAGFISEDVNISDAGEISIMNLDEKTQIIKETNEIFSHITERSRSCLKN